MPGSIECTDTRHCPCVQLLTPCAPCAHCRLPAAQLEDVLLNLWEKISRTSLFGRIKTEEALNKILPVFFMGPTHAREGPGHTYIYHEADRRGRRLNSRLHKFGTTSEEEVPQKRIAAQIINCEKNYVVDEVFHTKMHMWVAALVPCGRGSEGNQCHACNVSAAHYLHTRQPPCHQHMYVACMLCDPCQCLQVHRGPCRSRAQGP